TRYPLSSGLRCIGGNGRRMSLDLPDRFRDLVRVVFVTQQRKLWNPDCLPRRPMCMREALLQEFVLLCRLHPAEALAIFSAAEAIQLMQRGIACLCRNAFGIQCSDEILSRDTRKMPGIDMKDVRVLAIARAARIALLRRDARDLREQFVEQATVAMAMQSLFLQKVQLDPQNCSLPLAEPVIRSIDEVAIKPFSGHPSAVVHGARLALESVVIRDDDSALSCCAPLARLEAERARLAKCADPFPPPLAAMGVRRIFDEMKPMSLRKLA